MEFQGIGGEEKKELVRSFSNKWNQDEPYNSLALGVAVLTSTSADKGGNLPLWAASQDSEACAASAADGFDTFPPPPDQCRSEAKTSAVPAVGLETIR